MHYSSLPRRLAVALMAGSALGVTTLASAETFFDVGLNASHIEAKVATANGPSVRSTETSGGLHVGVGARRTLAGGNEIGVRLELDDVDGNLLVALRPLDYRFNVSERLALGIFLGAARLDLATPAYGYYLGGGLQFKELVRGWDLSLDLRLGDKIARDNLLPSDPQGGSSDNFYDLTGLSVYLGRRF